MLPGMEPWKHINEFSPEATIHFGCVRPPRFRENRNRSPVLGDKLLEFVCPQNGTAVLNGFRNHCALCGMLLVDDDGYQVDDGTR